MNVKKLIQTFYSRHGKKALWMFLVYFVVKWTLTIVFGAKILTYFKSFF